MDQVGFSFCEPITALYLPELYASLNVTSFHFLLNELDKCYGDSTNVCNSASLLKLNEDNLEKLRFYFNLCSHIDETMNLIFYYLSIVVSFALRWLFISFLIPIFFASILFLQSFLLFLSKKIQQINDPENAYKYQKAKYNKYIGIFWECLGEIWHGHELIGLENFPDTGPALLIVYHAAMPVDLFYVDAKVFLYKNRKIKYVGDKIVNKVPGLGCGKEAYEAKPRSQNECIDILKKGHLMGISPGGVREALFSTHENYEIVWKDRIGFAEVATEARVPILPMFTKNSREALRVFPYFKSFFQYVYEKTRMPLCPIFGIFPVKLVTYIGEPIEFDPKRSAKELKELTKTRIEELIHKHQRLPGNMTSAFLERFF